MKWLPALVSGKVRLGLALLAMSSGSTAALAADGKGMLLTRDGLGPIRIGLPLAEVRKAFPKVRFKRCEDGDGVALVCLGKPYEGIILYANEEDRGQPINWQARVANIETFRWQDRTLHGLHSRLPIRTAEKRLGPILSIVISDIEQRQYLQLAGQPDWLSIRINYNGIFAEGERTTRHYEAKGVLLSISTGG